MKEIKNLRNLIAYSKVDEALIELLPLLEHDEGLQNECIMLQARVYKLKETRDKNLVSISEYNIEFSKINQAALHLLNKAFIFSQKISHSELLKEMVLNLDGVDIPVENEIQNTVQKIGNNVTDIELLDAILGVLPYPLGIRLRQMVADSWDKQHAEKYYTELLYDYALFFETQLSYLSNLLISQIWEFLVQIEGSEEKLKGNFTEIQNYISSNHITMEINNYGIVISEALNVLSKFSKKNIISNLVDNSIKCLNYLRSQEFVEASIFFDNRKKEFWGNKKVFMTEDSIIEYCERSQYFILASFSYFKFIVEYALFMVQDVDVVNFRHTEKDLSYNNSYSLLLESHFGRKGANVEKSKLPMENKFILCFNNIKREGQSLNLFPFLINRNAFAKKSSENDLYQFVGFFSDEWINSRAKREIEQRCFYFISLKNPKNIWQFDVERYYNNDLSHINEVKGLTGNEMNNTRDLKNFFESFLLHLI